MNFLTGYISVVFFVVVVDLFIYSSVFFIYVCLVFIFSGEKLLNMYNGFILGYFFVFIIGVY